VYASRVKAATTDPCVQWLLDGDPAVRWQTLRDLVGAGEKAVAEARARVAREGWGARLLEKQDADGRWAGGKSSDGGLYTPKWISTTYTLLALRDLGLPPDERRGRKLSAVRAAQERGREFLLVHRLFRSHRTGAVIRPEFLKFAFPPRWHYDVLRALDYFQAVSAPRDNRLAEAVEITRNRRNADRQWLLEKRHSGKTYFELERVGSPSRCNTLRALGCSDGGTRAPRVAERP
jgi:hypothetical protein